MYQADKSHSLIHRLHQIGFNALYSRSLLYNTCWEDPSIDREAMQLNSNDCLAMITSAGCNALDYAIEGVKRIACIDANPRQTALLNLKIAGIRSLDYDDFFKIFGLGAHPDMRTIYRTALRKHLPVESRDFWRSRLSWWDGRGWRDSFYYYGLSGFFAKLMTAFIPMRPRLYEGIHTLFEAQTIEEQREVFEKDIVHQLFGCGMKWVLGRQITMNLLGVPREQSKEVAASHQNGIAGYIEQCLTELCCELPLQDNYFWRVYLFGHYEKNCCPRYLQESYFHSLKNGHVDAIESHTMLLTAFLNKEPDNAFSKFLLLDHMDWMGSAWPEPLCEEWRELFRCGKDNCQMLFRSSANNPAFLRNLHITRNGVEKPIGEHLLFDTDTANQLHSRDRVHTYASFHIATPKTASEDASC